MTLKHALLTLLLGFARAERSVTSLGASRPSAPLPEVEIASRGPNAFRIFNAVHSALRQWGSSIQHNGLSFFPVTVPEGNLFYHGRHSTERPDTLEWLAFEMEHASQFAQCWEFTNSSAAGISMLNRCFKMIHDMSMHGKVSSTQPRDHSNGDDDDRGDQVTLLPAGDDARSLGFPPDQRGYLHTYKAARPLNLLYLDGMAAAKCYLGTLDSQNYILLDWTDRKDPMRNEGERAEALCEQAREAGIDGFVRMEAGFEIIYCDFSEGAGLDLVAVYGSPWLNETHASKDERPGPGGGWFGLGGEWFVRGVFEWMRASAARYHGLPAGRAEVDFSGMLSAFMYDVNTTNPDAERPELPRIVSAGLEERRGIKDRVWEVVKARKGRTASAVGWQAVVDNIVTRFADRLWFLSESPLPARQFRSQIATLLYPFLDYPDDLSLEDVSAPVERCTDIHLSLVTADQTSWTPEDRAIYAAVRTVSHTICASLFNMRKVIHTTNGTTSGDEEVAAHVQSMARELRAQLNWTTWKECGKCAAPDQMCYVAMFPVGDAEDHFSPRCKTQEEINFGYFLEPNF
jgi:hypothetical protein